MSLVGLCILLVCPNAHGVSFNPTTAIPHLLHPPNAQAERALLAAALQDPYNHRFALVSDSSVPLYDAVLVYEQFMSQSSYQDACDLDDEGWGMWFFCCCV